MFRLQCRIKQRRVLLTFIYMCSNLINIPTNQLLSCCLNDNVKANTWLERIERLETIRSQIGRPKFSSRVKLMIFLNSTCMI